jgi:hypothetical protein
MIRGSVFLAALAFSAASLAQSEETRTLEVDGGASVTYTLVSHPAGAHLARPADALAPTSALNSSRLLNHHLAGGDLVEAALLSNSPRRRFEVLRDYRESVGENEFKRVFAQYFVPENRLLAEIAIDNHRLLVWDLKQGATRIAGQYFVEIEGRYFIDDVPNDVRTRLRWVLEAYRNGKIKY